MTAELIFDPPLATMRDVEGLEHRISQLESLVQKLSMIAHVNGDFTANDVRIAYGLEPWHGKAKGSE